MHAYLLEMDEKQKKFRDDFPASFEDNEFNLDLFLYNLGFDNSVFIKKRYKLDFSNKYAQLLLKYYPEAIDGDYLDIEKLSKTIGRKFYLFDNRSDMDIDELDDNVDIIVSWVKKRISENRNNSIVFTGQTGSGKSYSAIALAEKLDPGFNVNRIVFDVKSFLKLSTSNLPKGSVLIFDDAGVNLSSRDWAQLSVKVFSKFAQNSRYLNLTYIYTVPSMSYIEKISRELVNLYFESTKVQGDMKVLEPFTPFRGSSQLGFRFPKIWIGNIPITIKKMHFELASKDLLEAYEKSKQTYMNKINKEFLKEIEEAEKEKKEKHGKKNSTDGNKSERDKTIKIIKMKMDGFSVREIALELGIPKSTVHTVIKQFDQ